MAIFEATVAWYIIPSGPHVQFYTLNRYRIPGKRGWSLCNFSSRSIVNFGPYSDMSTMPPWSAVPAGQHAPFAVVTPNDHSAWVIIASALGLALTLLFGAIRIFVRATVGGGHGLDDYMVTAGTVSYIRPNGYWVYCVIDKD